MTSPPVLVSSDGPSGVPPPVTINNAMITFSRLSSQDSSPLVSRLIISPVSSALNGTVVNCIEGFSSTESVATTTIRIIDPGQFGKKLYNLLRVETLRPGWEGGCIRSYEYTVQLKIPLAYAVL